MAIGQKIKYAGVDELFLDPRNPRLGRSKADASLPQEKVLDIMRDWTLGELAVSFLVSGYWPNEALLVVEEEIYGENKLVVVEGNRRLAAIKFIYDTIRGKPVPSKWKKLLEPFKVSDKIFKEIPYLQVDSRIDVESFLGFRHVTGIKEWKPAEKAQFIAKLIEERSMGYEDVMRRIGSKTPAVRQHYISYRLLLQMEGAEEISIEKVESKFSVLYLSLRTDGVRKYLDINIKAEPKDAKHPVPEEKLKKLANFVLWLFGDDLIAPIITDSRYVDAFGSILESPEAVMYLEETEEPKFEVAFRKAGGDEPELIRLVNRATDNVQLTLSTAHHYLKSKKLKLAVNKLSIDVDQLVKLFSEGK